MWESVIPAVASLFLGSMGAKAGAGAVSNVSALSPEQRALWQNIIMPEVTSRYMARGKLPTDIRNMYLSDILGGVEQGYTQNVNSLNRFNLDPNTKRNLMFQLGRDKAANTAGGFRSLVDMENKRFDDSVNMATGLGTKSLPMTQQTNPGAAGNAYLFGNLSSALGALSGNMASFKGGFGDWWDGQMGNNKKSNSMNFGQG